MRSVSLNPFSHHVPLWSVSYWLSAPWTVSFISAVLKWWQNHEL